MVPDTDVRQVVASVPYSLGMHTSFGTHVRFGTTGSTAGTGRVGLKEALLPFYEPLTSSGQVV